MHHLANLTALYDKGGLHTLADGNQVMMNGAHCEQRRNGCVLLIDIAVAEDDVVVAVVDAAFGLLAECIERLAQSVFALAALKQHRQLDGVKSLVAYIAQYIELGIGQNGVGQTHHLAVRLVGRENS